jgi:hypothetical protein
MCYIDDFDNPAFEYPNLSAELSLTTPYVASHPTDTVPLEDTHFSPEFLMEFDMMAENGFDVGSNSEAVYGLRDSESRCELDTMLDGLDQTMARISESNEI